MLGVLLAAVVSAGGGCTKDTDCKGDRVCEAGKCVSPPPAAAPLEAGDSMSAPPMPPPPPPPLPLDAADFPKVVRKNGLTCVQSLGPDGQVVEDCRTDATAYSGTPSDSPSSGVPPSTRGADQPERSSVVADFAAFGNLGLIVGSSVVVIGGFGLHASVAGRVSDTAAIGGLLDLQMYLAGLNGGFLFIGTLAPALRLGEVGHATIGLGPTIFYASVGGTSAAVLMGTLLVHGGFPVAGAFGLHPRLSLSFNTGGAILGLGFGFGGSVF